jgi:hypothetical protein
VTALRSFSVDEVRVALSNLSPDERVELQALLAKGKSWVPLPGAQTEAYYSEADVTGYGGAAGGGKTDLACGLALVDHQRSIIYRREAAQLTAIVDRLEELLKSRGGYNGSNAIWKLPGGRQIEFGGFPNPGDEKRFQGRPHDLKVFDEVTEMLEAQVRYLCGWLRSSKKVRQRILMTFNPPTRPEGRWVVSYFGPWLDKRHPMYPTPPGVLRWVTTVGGEDIWLPDGRPFVYRDSSISNPSGNGERVYDFDPAEYRGARGVLVIRPMSRTFIPARVTDNPFYMASDYLAKLQALPEPLRSQMLYGDFEAGMQDDEWQVIPTAHIRASMARWKAARALGPAFKVGPMDSLGVDVARGGRDKFVIARRHGRFVDELIRYPGAKVKTGNQGAGEVIRWRRNSAPVHVDVIGYGASTHDALVEQGVQSVAVNVATGATGRALKSGMGFANKRAELVWRLAEALDPELGDDALMLPDDPQLEQDLASYRWFPVGGKIQIAPKADMQKKIGRSPDDGDAVCLCLIDTVREATLLQELQQVNESRRSSDPWSVWEDY